MRIVIAGAFGYLGERLSEHLARSATKLVVMGSGQARDKPSWLLNGEVVKLHWNDVSSLEKVLTGADVIIHASGMNAWDCATDPRKAIEVNGLFSANLLAAAINSKVKRFLYFSTAHVYRPRMEGSIDERLCTSNIHPYATSHRIAEDAVQYAIAERKIEGVIFRMSNSFGAPVNRAANCWMLLINDLCIQAVRTGTMIVKSAPSQQRNFIPLREVCNVVDHFLAIPATSIKETIYNIGSAWSPSIAEVAEVIQKVFSSLGRQVNIHFSQDDTTHFFQPLSFSIERLLSTNYVPLADDCVYQEIRRLAIFCIDNNTTIPA